MRHADSAALESVVALLAKVRTYPQLTERKPGIFYRKSGAFLHFHEDLAGLFADVKVGKAFERMPVNSPPEQRALLTKVGALLR